MVRLNSIKQINDFLNQRGERLKSVSPMEIENIERKYEVRLPSVYRDFLDLMGKSAGNYMLGSSVFYDELFSLKQGVEELVEENNLEPIPASAFIFWMHQGYQAAFFNIGEGDNPPVYYFTEGQDEKKFILVEESLTNFFFEQLLMSYPDIQ